MAVKSSDNADRTSSTCPSKNKKMAYPNITVENVLPKLLEWSQAGQRVCLATLYHSYGTSPRPKGSQMAIAEDGRWFGYLSGGCAEQAIASEGVASIKSGRNRSVRYGVGSPYLDIQLPCGAGIDVWFDQGIELSLVKSTLEQVDARALTGLQCETLKHASQTIAATQLGSDLGTHSFRRWYTPARRLYLIGAGPAVAALAVLAREADYSVEVLSPDEQTLSEAKKRDLKVSLLSDQAQIQALATDPWTSVVLMFHEHERETNILQRFLESDVAYIGALGSTRTHNARLDSLKAAGINSEQCARIHGPVGLEIQAKAPTEIAISVLAELTLKYQHSASPVLEWGGGEVLV